MEVKLQIGDQNDFEFALSDTDLEILVDKVMGCLVSAGDAGKVASKVSAHRGWNHEADREQVTVVLHTHEAFGGAMDGRELHFRINITDLQELFEVVETVLWDTKHSCVLVFGVYSDVEVVVGVHPKIPPELEHVFMEDK